MRRGLVVSAVVIASLLLAGSCRTPKPSTPPATPPPSRAEDGWAARSLRALSLEQKVAQMIGVRAYGLYSNPESSSWRRLVELVRDRQVGCVVVFQSEVESLPRVVDDLQREAPIPLLVAADLERGMSFRIRRGVVSLPYAMAIGATGSEEAARFTGEVTAREGRALGIHWAFAPVADVNSNPANPVINIRSYGEDPGLVARLSAAFVGGARAGGMLTTVKHFPGHGDTAVDSHLQLASIDGDRDRLADVELRPFRAAIEAGVDSVMLGHIAVPALDPSGAPSTLSEPVATELLRRDLGFEGLIVTDAMEMSGVRAAWTGEAAVKAVRAGADLILLPPDPEVAIQSLVRAVREEGLPESRIDASVKRILEAKQRLGLQRERFVDRGLIGRSVDRPEDVAQALQVAQSSITLVRNEGSILPLRAETQLNLLHLVMSSDARNELIQGIPEAELAARRIPTETRALGPEVSEATAEQLVAAAAGFSHVIVSAFVRVTSSKGTTEMDPSHARLIERLQQTGRPLVVVSFGSPYLLRQFPSVPVYLCAYGAAESSQRAAVAALLGESPITGHLPVTLPDLYPRGHGMNLPKHEMRLRSAKPEEVGFRSGTMDEVDAVLERFLGEKAFPGGVLAVGRNGALVHLRPFGKLSYEPDAAPVQASTLYDLASLTKVIATTTMAMILVDEGRLLLDKPVRDFIPAFHGGDKDRVTVRHLLTHSSGVDWWAPLYQELRTREAFLSRIVAMDLKYEPGTKSVYSDLGVLLLGEILERVAGAPLDAFVRERVFQPLGLADTQFRPPKQQLPRIAPTEQDAWRARVVRGEVHDENAYALGGVAPHAGLFGTAPDLARFAQMLLNGGVYEHQRIVSRETLELFTRRAGVPDSSRALGWDTPSEGSSGGTLLSARAFGHTGFTGTSIWIDPEKQIFIILLTNRVHPTRENNLIRQARPAVADAVLRGLLPPVP